MVAGCEVVLLDPASTTAAGSISICRFPPALPLSEHPGSQIGECAEEAAAAFESWAERGGSHDNTRNSPKPG